jgi:hypothetical protein
VGETYLLRRASVLAFSHNCASRSCAPPVAFRRQPSYVVDVPLPRRLLCRRAPASAAAQRWGQLSLSGVMTANTASAALTIRYTPPCAVLRVSPPPGPSLRGGVHVRSGYPRRICRASAQKMRRLSHLPHVSGRIKAERGGTASSSQPPYPHPTGGVLMLAVVAPAASANIVKSPSLLNDAGHSAAHTHGFLLAEAPCSSPKFQR